MTVELLELTGGRPNLKADIKGDMLCLLIQVLFMVEYLRKQPAVDSSILFNVHPKCSIFSPAQLRLPDSHLKSSPAVWLHTSLLFLPLIPLIHPICSMLTQNVHFYPPTVVSARPISEV